MDPDFSDNISFYLAYTACVVLFFFSVRLFFKHVLSCSEIVAVTAVALSHHIAVVAYSVLYNDAYLTLLHAGILFNTDGCGALSLRTDQVYYTGIFAVVYLAMDSVYAILMPAWRGEKRIDALLLFHHINGVALISCALFAGHGLYMVYISHIMEISSIFLGFKTVFRHYGISGVLKDINDVVFAFSFLVCRVYLTLSSVFIAYSLYCDGCWRESFTFVDMLVIYCCGLYVALTVFWSFGIATRIAELMQPPKPTNQGVKCD